MNNDTVGSARVRYPSTSILGIPVARISEDQTLVEIRSAIERHQRLWIVTANVRYLMLGRRDATFHKILLSADLIVPDGVPLQWVARLKRRPLLGRVNGTDLVWRCAALSAQTGATIALVGGFKSVADRAAKRIRTVVPGARLVTIETPTPFDIQSYAAVAESVRAEGADIVLAGLPTGLQERWLTEHGAATGARVWIGTGGSFDIISGAIRRAPAWMQRAGLEWLWRLSQEPRRLWRRYLWEDLPFVWLAAQEIVRDSGRGQSRVQQ